MNLSRASGILLHPTSLPNGVLDHEAYRFVDWLAAAGQLWGNPLYDWTAMRSDGYRWWIERLRRTFELVDLTRIDHFRGFVSYWAVPEGNTTAETGRWRRGPGLALFEALQKSLGDLPVVAEDLGVITAPVTRLRHELGLPGMVVLQFALGADPLNPHLPQNHEEQSVVYTGTHDNDTTCGWWARLSSEERAWSELDPADPARSLLEVAWASRAALAVAPLQDALSLGTEARMNLPGTEDGNWQWRFAAGDLTDALARGLRELTERNGRLVR